MDMAPDGEPVLDPKNHVASVAKAIRLLELFTHEQPELNLGPATARWLNECFAAIDRVMQPDHLAEIMIPTLVLAPTQDVIVPYAAQERLTRHFRAGQLITVTGARHELLQERDQYRAQAFAAIDAFIPGSDVATSLVASEA